MNKIQMDIVKKTTKKDSVGNPIETFETIGEIRTGYLLPNSSDNAKKEFGFEEKTTHKAFTREEIAVNSFLQHKGKLYRVRFVAEYPNHKTILLELI